MLYLLAICRFYRAACLINQLHRLRRLYPGLYRPKSSFPQGNASGKIFFYYSWADATRFSVSISVLPSCTSLTYASAPGCLGFFSTRWLSPPKHKLTETKFSKIISWLILFCFLFLVTKLAKNAIPDTFQLQNSGATGHIFFRLSTLSSKETMTYD